MSRNPRSSLPARFRAPDAEPFGEAPSGDVRVCISERLDGIDHLADRSGHARLDTLGNEVSDELTDGA